MVLMLGPIMQCQLGHLICQAYLSFCSPSKIVFYSFLILYYTEHFYLCSSTHCIGGKDKEGKINKTLCLHILPQAEFSDVSLRQHFPSLRCSILPNPLVNQPSASEFSPVMFSSLRSIQCSPFSPVQMSKY